MQNNSWVPSGHEIARGERPELYENAGWVCWQREDGSYAIDSFSHCSCYETWDSVSSDGGSSEWTGTREQLIHLAVNRLDPAMPVRHVNSGDYDSPQLLELYDQLLKHFGVEAPSNG